MNWYFVVLTKHAVFAGRARRKEYWVFFLWNICISLLLGFVLGVVGRALHTNVDVFTSIYSLAILLPSLAVGVRRMHDTDHSGWWLLLPIANLIFLVRKGDLGSNRYGADSVLAV